MRQTVFLALFTISCAPVAYEPSSIEGTYEAIFALLENSCDLELPTALQTSIRITATDPEEQEFDVYVSPLDLGLPCNRQNEETEKFSCEYGFPTLGGENHFYLEGSISDMEINGELQAVLVDFSGVPMPLDYKNKEKFLNALRAFQPICAFKYTFGGEKI